MSTDDLFLHAVEAIYASGMEDGRLPEALAATSSLLGSCGATLEVIDKKAMRHLAFCAAGLPRSPARNTSIIMRRSTRACRRSCASAPANWAGIINFSMSARWRDIRFTPIFCPP